MKGSVKIINSPADKKVAGVTKEQIINMATIQVRCDDALYPDDYDHGTIQVGDVGYIEPIYRTETEVDQVVLDRFGI